VRVDVVVPLAVGVMFLVIGNYLPVLRSNWFVGVRTPWTLSSEESWRRTHRLAGRLFMLSGAAVVLITVVDSHWGITAILATCVGSAAISIVYSYVVWRRDLPHAGSKATGR
jgi:uncharacterized membrane protein